MGNYAWSAGAGAVVTGGVAGGADAVAAAGGAVALATAVVAAGLLGLLIGLVIGRAAGRRQGLRGGGPEQLLQQIQQRVDGLASVFEVPRYRGEAGEWLLERLLQDCLPPSAYQTQYGFRNGTRVDALVQLGDVSVGVDAKFPLESIKGWREGRITGRSRKAVLQHAEAIATRYILPDEGTMNFAMMYIPSEAVFSRLFADEGLLRGCLQLGVVPAAPSNLFLYLQTVSYGLRGMEFSRNFSRYASQFERIRLELGQLAELLATGRGHLRNLQRGYDAALQQLDAVQGRMEGL
ncbi:DNA recombination protein RmuC [Spirochaeta africana]|uniref:DNA recombination protein RmuC n=1 Tax=Spirochaeta africana (strain ATCC 700263 / DSM 8902 / Z-7692) TaxID=889378 RepID=H9UGC3_SPIAZ|nr:DNA recombination protein RmuC [Spirochaeta africana]AFG36566.1 hypothetical protein Spiaf_0463 [Spirochaeta africana DSM 8902]